MNKAIKLSLTQLTFILLTKIVFSQTSVNTGNGTIIENGIKVHYSIGQVFFKNYQFTNGEVNEGIQQPLIIIPGSIDKISPFQNTISIFPNPASTSIRIKNTSGVKNVKVQIFNLNGQNVLERQLFSEESSIDVANLTPSQYSIIISDYQNEIINHYKLIKN
jgi:hypothetical protein